MALAAFKQLKINEYLNSELKLILLKIQVHVFFHGMKREFLAGKIIPDSTRFLKVGISLYNRPKQVNPCYFQSFYQERIVSFFNQSQLLTKEISSDQYSHPECVIYVTDQFLKDLSNPLFDLYLHAIQTHTSRPSYESKQFDEGQIHVYTATDTDKQLFTLTRSDGLQPSGNWDNDREFCQIHEQKFNLLSTWLTETSMGFSTNEDRNQIKISGVSFGRRIDAKILACVHTRLTVLLFLCDTTPLRNDLVRLLFSFLF